MLKDEKGISFVAVIITIVVLLIFSLITINVAVNQNEKNSNINAIVLQNESVGIDNKTQEDVGNAWTDGNETKGQDESN